MHTHQSLWNDDEPLFYDKNGYALLSDMLRHYIGVCFKHAPAFWLRRADHNSYRRLVPGYEAPSNCVLARIGRMHSHPDVLQHPRRVAWSSRPGSHRANPYLAFSPC